MSPSPRIPVHNTIEFRIAYQSLSDLLDSLPSDSPERPLVKQMLNTLAGLAAGVLAVA